MLYVLMLTFLGVTWHYGFYHALLHIERTCYRKNWERDVRDIGWLGGAKDLLGIRGRMAYDALAESWLFFTPGWARDHKTARLLIRVWRAGHLLIVCALFGGIAWPLPMDALGW